MFFSLVHLKGKQHRRMAKEKERKAFRRKLDNALPSLVDTLELLRAQKELEEKENQSASDEDDAEEFLPPVNKSNG